MGGLGTNPVEELLHRSGWWALAFLMTTLAVTPLRRLTGTGWLIKLRRTFGLIAFFYAALHFSIYLGVDQFFAWEYILEDIGERPYITVGFSALLMLTALAVTSTKKMVKRLGGKRWARLHRLVYVAAALGVLHFWWLVKADIREPAIFAAILLVLLGYRAAGPLRRRWTRRRTGSDGALLPKTS
jgi:sulfoxide reductase heme-binding subunit YedZ